MKKSHSHGRWRMMAPTGTNSKKRKRDQTKLLGRRKRVRSGKMTGRGPGRTTHGYR